VTGFAGNPIAEKQSRVIVCTWIFILCVAAIDAFLLYDTGMRLSPRTLPFTLSVFAATAAITAIYRYLRKDFGIYIALQITNQMVIGSLLLAGLSYLGAWYNYPFIDESLEILDHIPGMEWLSYVTWVNGHRLIADIYSFCYHATGPEIPFLLVLLFLLKDYVPLQRFAIGFLLGGFVTVVLATFWPARVAFEYRGIASSVFPYAGIPESLRYLHDYYGMRNHTLQVLPDMFEGMVEFPSFHSTIAVLAIAAAGSLKNPALRYLMIGVNLIMLLATPVQGGHYFIDTIAGILFGIIIIIFLNRIIPFEKTAKNAKEILSSVKEPA
jgi:membrane-associated phospholipid phosphatase